MAAALAIGTRTRGRTAPNPNVGCVIVRGDRVVGRGWTQPGGRPHAEAMALAAAGEAARGASAYVTLEPCAHVSARGPACSDLLIAAGVARVLVAIEDPDPRTAGTGIARLRAAGIAVDVGVLAADARRSMAGFLTRQALGRPAVTLKLATSLDGCIALADGRSRWITGPAARAHAHLERSRHDAILVGAWDVRCGRAVARRAAGRSGGSVAGPGDVVGNARNPRPPPTVVTPTFVGGDEMGAAGGRSATAWTILDSPSAIATLPGDHLLVEGGAQTAAAFLRDGLVDRLLLYRAPILIGGGRAAIGDIGLADLADAHGRWRLHDTRMLGSDRVEVYEAN